MSGIPSENVITGKADEFNAGLGGHASGGIPKSTLSGSTGGTGAGDGFNAGLGGHASGGIPKGTPIADKFMNESPVSGAYESGASSNALTGSDGARTTGAGVGYGGSNLQGGGTSGAGSAGGLTGAGILGAAGGAGAAGAALHSGSGRTGVPSSSEPTVSGAYEGGSATNALTGESGARTTGAGVGYDGENLSSEARSAALSSTAKGAAAGAGTVAAGSAAYGTGVGAAGGSGGHYRDESSTGVTGGTSATSASGVAGGVGAAGLAGSKGASSAGGPGAAAVGSGNENDNYTTNTADIYEAQRAGARGSTESSGISSSLAGTAGAGAAAGAGAGAAAAAAAGGAGAGAGHYGNATVDPSRGEPISDPKEVDSGGRHGLVYDEASGKYEHRHVLEEDK